MAEGSLVDQARAHLESARSEAQEQIERLQNEVAQLNAAIAALPSTATVPAEKPAPANGRRRRGRPRGSTTVKAKAKAAENKPAQKSPPANGRRRRSVQSRPGTISAAVEDFLDTHHPKAVHANDVLQHLTASDRAPGGNARNVLQSTLNRLQDRGSVKNEGKNRWRRVRRGPRPMPNPIEDMPLSPENTQESPGAASPEPTPPDAQQTESTPEVSTAE